jgi:uncharacterized protein
MKQLFITLTFLFSLNALALDVPTLTGPVVDKANVLTNDADLERQIRALYNNGQGPQVNILIIDSLKGANLEEYAHKVFTTWKLGDVKRDDGVLFLLVINDRKMRIEVGQGLEGGLTDLQTKRILGSLKPYLRSQDYNSGVQEGLRQIIQAASQPEAVQQPIAVKKAPVVTSTASNEDMKVIFLGLITGLVLLVLGVAITKSVKSYYREYNEEVKDLESDVERLVQEEKQLLNVADTYQDKISKVEKKEHLPLEDVVKKFKKELNELELMAQNQNSELATLAQKETSCPVVKLEHLRQNQNSLASKIKVSQNNIKKYQTLIEEEGK